MIFKENELVYIMDTVPPLDPPQDTAQPQNTAPPQDTAPQQEPTVNLAQLAAWLVIATSKTKNFMIRPSDLKNLYLLMLWEYLARHHTSDELQSDESICLPEKEVVAIVHVYYNSKFHPFFNRLQNL